MPGILNMSGIRTQFALPIIIRGYRTCHISHTGYKLCSEKSIAHTLKILLRSCLMSHIHTIFTWGKHFLKTALSAMFLSVMTTSVLFQLSFRSLNNESMSINASSDENAVCAAMRDFFKDARSALKKGIHTQNVEKMN